MEMEDLTLLIYKANTGRIYEELVKVPRERWSEKFETETWMTLAARGDNPVAIFELWKHDPSLVNTTSTNGHILTSYLSNLMSPLYWTCHYGQHGMTNLLLVLGARMHPSALSISIMKWNACFKVLIANGLRLKSLSLVETHIIVDNRVEEFEERVIQCRDVIVILLGLRKRRHIFLYKLDKFLIAQELAPEIWATRYTFNDSQ